MDDNTKVIRTGVIIIFVLIVAVATWYFFFSGKGKGAGTADPTAAAPKAAADDVAAKDAKSLAGLAVDLDKSDDGVRGLIQELSSNPAFGQWLKTKDLIRKFVAAVDAIANGQSPRPQMDFFVLAGPFKTLTKNGVTTLDPAGYDRYNIIADIFDSVSTAGCARLYGGLRPLLQTAYRELGYPKEDFHQTLLKAIVEILKVPVVDEPIALEKKIASFGMTDPKLEELSAAQKHVLRMGPENLQLIQVKLREIGLALGFADAQLPRPKAASSVPKK
jgi:hypothetical protein